MDTAKFKQEFDARLLRFLKQHVEEAQHLANQATVEQWLAYFSVLLLSGGKRLRPYVLSTMYQTAGGTKDSEMWQAAMALELFHLFALIHDDIMDHSELRHGVASTHTYITKALGSHPNAAHIGVSQAIILGDLLQNWAAQTMPTPVLSLYHTMATEVMVGQMLDVNLMHNSQVDTQEILDKHELKTARYTFVRPMQMGTTLAGASEDLLQFCAEFGTDLGIAFQIQDDLIDITESTHVARKPTLRDIQTGQPTLFTVYIKDHGTPAQKAELNSYFGRALHTGEYKKASKLFIDAGAVEYGLSLVDHYCKKAEKVVKIASFSAEQKETWLELILQIRFRQH